MSIILDALKKLDRERAGRRDGPPNIDTEILRPSPPPRRKRTPLYFATLLLTAAAATAMTYAVVVWYGFPSKSGPPASMSSSVPKQPGSPILPETISTPTPLPPASVSSPAPKQQPKPVPPNVSSPSKSLPSAPLSTSPPNQPAEPAPLEASPSPKLLPPVSVDSSTPSGQFIPDPPSQAPARASSPEASQDSSKIQSPPETKAPAAPQNERKEGQNAVSGKGDTAPGNKGKGVGSIPSGSSMGSLPLRITVISWDEDPSKRFAFVNGMMVHEGDIIDEAKIVEIYPKRIRFLHNGQYFEVRM